MNYRFSQTAHPRRNLSITLERIFDVRADREYDVSYDDTQEGFAVFRTISGYGRIILADGRVEDQRDESLIIVRINEIKRYLCKGNSWDFLWFRFLSCDSLPLPVNRTIEIPYRGEEQNLIDQCLELIEVPYDEAGALGSSLLAMLIHRWSYEWIQSIRPRTIHQKMIDQIVVTMKQDLSRKLSVDDMALKSNLSERQFRTVFKSVTGLSPREYYHKIRMEHAADLLSFSHLSVGETADRLGYCDQFHFSKVFKEYHRSSPREYSRS